MKAPGNTTRRIRFLLGCLLAVLLFVWMGRRTNFGEVTAAMRAISPWAFAGTLMIIYLSIPLRILQWRALLGPADTPAFGAITRSLCLGYLGAAVAPTGGSELIKTYALSRASALPFSRILASVVVVRIQDLPPVAILAVGAFWLLPASVATAHQSVLDAIRLMVVVFAIISGASLGVLLLLAPLRDPLLAVQQRAVARFLPKAAEVIVSKTNQFVLGLSTSDKRRAFGTGQMHAAICWTLFAVAPVPLLLSLGLNLGQSFMSAIAVVGIATLVQLVPLTPGGLGTYHLTCVWVLTIMNPQMSQSAALAYAVISHLLGMFGPALFGIFALPWGISKVGRLTDVQKSAAELMEAERPKPLAGQCGNG